MTGNDTEYTRYARTPEGAIELAAAAATAEVSRIFRRLTATANRTQALVAEQLKVTEGRVSQVLNGDGNVSVAALAKYARAYGYTLTFVLTPAEPGLPAISTAPARRRRADDGPATTSGSGTPESLEALAKGWFELRGIAFSSRVSRAYGDPHKPARLADERKPATGSKAVPTRIEGPL